MARIISFLKGEKEMKNKIIAVDFDGTLCENKWPEIGKANKEMPLFPAGSR